ncbi:WecB/TagA/CpsF family glycosyltransferase [Bacteroidia bacterium]|nr:WecB/TagA/CpsF family glycosyltransferase [Bacteroidia bacterium]
MTKLEIVTDTSQIHLSRIYVALNLMTLANLEKFHNERNVYWLDGVFGVLFCNLKGLKGVKKNPGRNVLSDLLNQFDKDLLLFGNLSGNPELDSRFKCISELQDFANEIDDIQVSDITDKIIVISLPSPLQEELAHKLDESNTVYCIGGALNMLGDKKFNIPRIIDYVGLEFLWRLRSDSKRRIKRLLKSFLNVIAKSHLILKEYSAQLID